LLEPPAINKPWAFLKEEFVIFETKVRQGDNTSNRQEAKTMQFIVVKMNLAGHSGSAGYAAYCLLSLEQ
jgi:hypothetical protein